MATVPPASPRQDVFGENSRFGHRIEPEKPQGNFLTKDRKVTLTVNPWRNVKRVVLITMLIGVFLVGSWMSTSACNSDDPTRARWCFSPFDHQGSLTGAAVADLPGQQAAPIVAPVETIPVVEIEPEPVVEEVKAEPTPAPKEEVKVEEDDEPQPVITMYTKNVVFTLDKVTSTSMGNWGKVTRLDVTIRNNEVGIVEPYKMVMTMEGYDDRTKAILLPEHLGSIRSGKYIAPSIEIDGAFSYNNESVEDKSKVLITLYLMDKAGKTMAQVQKDVKLE